jgi:hypothetical protein
MQGNCLPRLLLDFMHDFPHILIPRVERHDFCLGAVNPIAAPNCGYG